MDWEKGRGKEMQKELVSVECDIHDLQISYKTGKNTTHVQQHLMDMELKRRHMLLMEEEKWILKSWDIWLSMEI